MGGPFVLGGLASAPAPPPGAFSRTVEHGNILIGRDVSLCARMAPALYLCQKHPRIFSRILAHRYSANWECCSPSGSGTISRLRDSRAYSRAHVFPTFLNRNMFWRKCLNLIPDKRVSGNPFVSCTSSHLSLCVAPTNILAHLVFPKNFNDSLHVVFWASFGRLFHFRCLLVGGLPLRSSFCEMIKLVRSSKLALRQTQVSINT